MARVIYKLWISGDLVGTWIDPVEMTTGVHDYIEANPENLPLLHLTGFTSSRRRGASPAFTFTGEDILTFLSDLRDA